MDHEPRHLLAGKHLRERAAYRLRLLFSQAATLLLILILLHLPPFGKSGLTQWHTATPGGADLPDYISIVETPELDRTEQETAEEGIDDAREEIPETESLVRREVPNSAVDGETDGVEWGEALEQTRTLRAAKPRALQAVHQRPSISRIQLAPPPKLPDSKEIENAPELEVSTLHIHYPEDARKKGIQGLVVLHFLVDSEGRTSSIRVMEALSPSCDAAAIEAVQRARFAPGRDGGKPIAAFTRLGVRFILD